MAESGVFTYQTRLPARPAEACLLDSYADLYGRVERSLFAALAAGGVAAKLKSEYQKKFSITARQFNAISISLKGKIASIRERQKSLLAEAELKISATEKSLAKLKKLKPKSDEHRQKIDFAIHQKSRYLATKQARVESLRADVKAGKVRLCFGSKKLFNEQFSLAENGYKDHADWLASWRHARASEFFVIGSKDESGGCQGCVARRNDDGSLSLQLRLPNSIATTERKHIQFENVRFGYGQEQILESLAAGRAISYRFKRDETGWRVFASTEVVGHARVTCSLAGAIGIDINADHLALSHIDRFGNPCGSKRIDCRTYGATSDQARALIGDAVKIIVEEALATSRPIVIENLDFGKKKAALHEVDARYARMLSGFAYAQMKAALKAACLRAGLEIIEVNPAFTSVIGAINYAQRFGVSIHQGAAIAIARRGLSLSERPALRGVTTPARNGGHVTFALPVRNRAKHVWSYWSAIRTRLKAAHVAHARSGGPLAPPQPLSPDVMLAERSTWALPAKFRHANRQAHCSPDVFQDIPF